MRRAKDVRRNISVVEKRRKHSRKPDCVRERIERLVAGPYLELFARGPKKAGTVGAINLGCSMQAQSRHVGSHPVWLTLRRYYCDAHELNGRPPLPAAVIGGECHSGASFDLISFCDKPDMRLKRRIYAASAGLVGNMPGITIKPGTRLKRSHHRRMAPRSWREIPPSSDSMM